MGGDGSVGVIGLGGMKIGLLGVGRPGVPPLKGKMVSIKHSCNCEKATTDFYWTTVL